MSSPAQDFKAQLTEQTTKVVFGVENLLHYLAIALIVKGHVLVQGVPGLGKTLLAKCIAMQLSGEFKRVQCTADLMPSDITGIHVYQSETQQFVLMPGPVFSDLLLVDEINRTGPKTQSALLQAMEESAVTIDRDTYPLSDDFFVIATQNPHEFEGTYPLPESQLDRFLMRLEIDYPGSSDEESILRNYDKPALGHNVGQQLQSIELRLIEQARIQAGDILVSDAVYQYVISIAQASRVHHQVNLGLSNRGALSIMRCARVEAALRGGEFVTPDDVKNVCEPVMSHRLVLPPDAALDGIQTSDVVNSILDNVEVPRS